MKDLFCQYLIDLYRGVPQYVYEGLLSMFCIGAVVLFATKGFERAWRTVAGLLLLEYLIMLYCSMVLFRPLGESPKCNFHSFWSYSAIMSGRVELIPENVMNVLAFIIVGALLVCACRSLTLWKVTLIGGGMSLTIETSQFIFNRGIAEVDDVMHNTVGCLIGYGLYKAVAYSVKQLLRINTEE